MSSLEKTITSNRTDKRKQEKAKSSSDTEKDDVHARFQLPPISRQWGNELKVFLKLHSVRFD